MKETCCFPSLLNGWPLYVLVMGTYCLAIPWILCMPQHWPQIAFLHLSFPLHVIILWLLFAVMDAAIVLAGRVPGLIPVLLLEWIYVTMLFLPVCDLLQSGEILKGFVILFARFHMLIPACLTAVQMSLRVTRHTPVMFKSYVANAAKILLPLSGTAALLESIICI